MPDAPKAAPTPGTGATDHPSRPGTTPPPAPMSYQLGFTSGPLT